MDYHNLSDKELLSRKRQLELDISKYHNFQLSKKVQLNSAYGAMGNEFFRFYDIRLAEAVTLSGRVIIQWLAQDINTYLNKLLGTGTVDYVIAVDTDSLYITLDALVSKLGMVNADKKAICAAIDKIASTNLQNVIEKSCERFYEYLNARENRMVMKREAIADVAIWTRKKRYAMNLYNFEGVNYDTPKLKIMGLEAVKSSTPEVCRSKLKKAIELTLTSDNSTLINFIESFRDEFCSMEPEIIGSPTSVNGLETYHDPKTTYAKGAPYHVKAALQFNKLLKEEELDTRYSLIRDGDSIKTLLLKTPNPMRCSVIGYVDVLPREFGLERYIDYDSQFDKVFLKPLKGILDAIGWHTEHISTLSLWD
jgi:DNA polymerase elongation subunit (family B)